MPKWGYSTPVLETERNVRASGRELRISPKIARETCKAIKGMPLYKAKDLLQQVILKVKPIPFRRNKKKVGHRHGIQKASAGRYPKKVAEKILNVLENAEANAEYRGLDSEHLRIVHAAAYPGRKIRKFIPRAFGRASPYFDTLCHVEIVLKQMEIE
jgi:large subunit ribosomal protein L22